MYNPNQQVEKLRTDGGKVESWVVTFPATAGATHGDFVKLSTAGKTFAVWLDIDTGYSGIAEETTITVPATAAATQADYFHILNKTGTKFAIWLDIDAAGTAPTGALYVASDVQIMASISTGDSAIDNAASIVTAIGTSLTGITVLDNLDGTITFTCNATGVVTDAEVKNADDSGAGSFLKSIVQGVDGVSPAGPIYTACDYKIRSHILTGDTAAQVATKVHGATLGNSDFVRLMDSKDNLNGSITILQRQSGDVVNPVPKDITEAGAGSITSVNSDGRDIQNIAASSPSSFSNDPGLIT